MKLKTSFFVKVTNTQTANFILLMHNYFFEFYSALKKQSFVQYFFGKRFSFLSLLLIVFFAVNVPSAVAQVCGTSGWDGPQNAVPPVNTYFPLGTSTTLTAGSKTITLLAVPPNDPNYNLSYGITPIKSGDLILIIQMQDATIDYSNSNKYGSGTTGSGPDGKGGTGYTSLGSTGKFEYVVATSNVPITGGTLNFRGGGAGGGAVNTYTNSAATTTKGQSRFQVVRVPQYSNLVLTADITTPPYNGSVGGLIAFDVAGTMQFNGFKVDASERGFRGGYGPVANSNANNSTDYVLLSSSTKSVGKGEGVAGTPRYMWDGFNQVDNVAEGLPSGSYGRGAPANAGGGGNDHNAGGGGGGNAGFGGLGGMGWQGAGGDVDPKTGGGRPGSSLPLTVGNLIMGGGGGGGDANNATSGVKGGVGGGIVLINVEKIDGAGVIKANGGVGQAGTYGSQPDGAGGGGAGGSIFVRSLAASPTANLTLQANGGNGGNTINDTGSITPHGPGGGGGGGFIYTQVASAAIASSTTGGISGKTNNGAGITHGAQDGLAGITKTFVTTDLPTYLQGGGSICYPALDVTLSELNAGLSGARLAGTTATYKLRITNNVGGGNAGDVNADFILPNGFSLNSVSATLSGSTAGPTSPTFTAGSTGVISLGSYNISPGDYVEFTISVDIALTVPSGIYHASAQATYLDPTRTVANPLRKITANNNAFSGTNVTYETGGITNVPGTNYDGDLASATAEDVYVTAVPPLADCNAIVNGDFGFGSPGLYNGQSYFGWEGVNPGDQVSIYNLLGLFQGALIKGTYSLKQNILSIKPSTGYQLTFSYAKQFGCLTPSSAKITVKILDASTLQVLGTQNFSADLISKSGTVSFTTGTNTNALILEIIDNNSPNGSCSVYVDDFVITSPLVTGLNNINVSCKSLSDGSISITSLSNAAAPYKVSYSSDGGINYSSQINSGIITSSTSPLVFPNLSAGNYIIKVLDQNGCPTYRNITINEPDLLALSESHTTILCNGSTSTVSLTATGGTAPYQYSDDGGLTYQTQNTFPGLVAGNYNFLVKDTHNCTATISATITQPSLINLSEAHSAIVCNGGSSDVTLTATGGTGVLKYSADNLTYQTSGVFNGLTAGSYTFYTKDDNSCLKSIVVNITEPAVLTLTGTSTAVLCNGGTSEVTLTATGGTGAYQYSRDGTNYQPENTFSSLTAGTYSFIVKDANGCTSTVSAVITEPSELKLRADRTEIKCFGGTSDVELKATGGTGVYQYSRDGTSFQSGNAFTGLTAGTYSFIVKDANGCQATVIVDIAQPIAPLTLSSTKTDVKCHGDATGAIDLTATGGTGNYTFAWNNGKTTEDLTGLTAGTYQVTVTDANGCTAAKSVTIAQPSAPLTVTETHTDVKCYGGATGSIDITVTGGTAPYSYLWDNGATVQDLADISSGTYTFTVTDGNGCTATKSVTIVQPSAPLTVSETHTNVKCFGAASGSINISVNGGKAPYVYSWSNGTITQNLSALEAGDYTLTVKDANNCLATIVITISQPLAPLTLIENHEDILCYGDATGSISLKVDGGTAPYKYLWTNNKESKDLEGLKAGIYAVTVTDAKGCTIGTQIQISQPAAPLSITETHQNVACFGANTGSISINVLGGTAPYTYEWSNGVEIQNLDNLFAGVYEIKVTDKNGCTIVKKIQITQPLAPLALSETHINNGCYSDNIGKITLTVTGGVSPYTYRWSNGATTKNLANLAPGIYQVVVTDKNGCTQTLSTQILPLKPFIINEKIEQIKCFGENSGKINLVLISGEAPYQVSWSNGANGFNLQNLAPGNYTYFAKDSFGCVQTNTITITQPQPLSVKTEVKNTTCKYSPDGAIKLNVSGGSPPYRFIWNSTDRGANSSLLNVNAGKYDINIIDANNCSLQISAEILPGNCAPSADNDKYETTEDTPIIIHTPGIIINDIDPDDDDLRVTLGSAKDPNGETGDVDANQTVFKTKNGKITLNHDGSFTYIPNKNFFGTEYFIYEVTDGQLKSNFAQVTIVVTQVNDPPSAADDFFTTTEDIPLTGSLGSNDFDPEGDPLKYVVTNPPSSGNLTLNPDGTFTYVPEENYNGTITFDYQVCDPQGLCDQAKATIVINPANDAPIAQDDRFSIQRNGQISQTVTSNDSDPDRDALQFTKLTEPTNGTLVFNTNGTFVYQPKANFKGIDQFTYKACDPLGLCDEATVTLIVQPIVTVNLIPKEAIIKEGDSIKVTAVLTESLVEDVTVYLNYSGTAELNKDYVLSNNYLSLLIPANQSETTQYFSINTILDDIKDDNETVISNITSTSKPAFVNIGNNSTVTIKDVYPESVKTSPNENPDINPDPLVSPNGDGAGNESFIIYNITKYPNNEVLIFNRWGNKVYQTKGYDNKGNSFKGVANVGILTNTNKELVDGVYYYIIYTDQDNKRKMNKGYLILKR